MLEYNEKTDKDSVDGRIESVTKIPRKMRCKDCGQATRENTTGEPVGSCPERSQVYATHRYEVVGQ